jgi:V8-like Glu-specific endopeptidase
MTTNTAAHIKLAVAALIGIGAIGGAIWWPRDQPKAAAPTVGGAAVPRPSAAAEPVGPPAATDAATPAADLPPSSPPASLEEVVSRSLPAVVRIETATGLGSGFYIEPGTIVTNAHVVATNSTVTVRHASGTEVQGTVYTASRAFDLALVRVPAGTSVTPLPTGSALRARPGREVVALGTPLGLQNTVTRGVVSAVRHAGPEMLVQTDAAINPPNSGGPLLDSSGDVIAVTTMTVKPGEGRGLSFGVAAEHVRALLEGRLPLQAEGSPLSGFNQPPSPAAPTPERPQAADAREDGARAFEQVIARLGRDADLLDERFRSFLRVCYSGSLRSDLAHAWFALLDGRSFHGIVSPACEAPFAELKQFAYQIQNGVRAADEAARRADVYPGTRRDILQRYRLDYDAWTR